MTKYGEYWLRNALAIFTHMAVVCAAGQHVIAPVLRVGFAVIYRKHRPSLPEPEFTSFALTASPGD